MISTLLLLLAVADVPEPPPSTPVACGDVWTAFEADMLCGFCIVQSQTNTRQGFLGPIGLMGKKRGRGMGTLLMNAALNHLKKSGKNRVGLWTSEAIYRGFYQKLGFEKKYKTMHAKWTL